MDGAPMFQMRFNPTGDELAAALDCEASVFLKTYGNTPEQLAEEYGPYAAVSVFIGIYEPGGDAVGAVRLIRPSGLGLKTLHDVARLDLGRTWDFTTLGARRGLRRWSTLVSAGLFHGLVQTARANDIGSAVMMIDERVRGLLALAGMTGQTMPGAQTQSYMGSLRCTPVYEHCQQAFDRQRQVNPDGYRLFMQGIGLDGIAVPPPAAFRLQPVPAATQPAVSQPAANRPAVAKPAAVGSAVRRPATGVRA